MAPIFIRKSSPLPVDGSLCRPPKLGKQSSEGRPASQPVKQSPDRLSATAKQRAAAGSENSRHHPCGQHCKKLKQVKIYTVSFQNVKHILYLRLLTELYGYGYIKLETLLQQITIKLSNFGYG